MRHNPAAGAVVIMLRTLKMHGMAQAVGELTEQGSPAFEAALPILSQLLKAETADREVRSTAYQLKAARFPNYRDLARFDFLQISSKNGLQALIARPRFIGHDSLRFSQQDSQGFQARGCRGLRRRTARLAAGRRNPRDAEADFTAGRPRRLE